MITAWRSSSGGRDASFTVRTATDADEAVITNIDVATWSPSVSPGPPGEDQPFFGPDRESSDVLVVQADGAVVGWVLLGRDLTLPSADHMLALRGLAVDPDWQGRGLGRRLLEAAACAALNRGAQRLKSRVLSTNEASLAVHRACGFEVEGVLRGLDADAVQLGREQTRARDQQSG